MINDQSENIPRTLIHQKFTSLLSREKKSKSRYSSGPNSKDSENLENIDRMIIIMPSYEPQSRYNLIYSDSYFNEKIHFWIKASKIYFLADYIIFLKNNQFFYSRRMKPEIELTPLDMPVWNKIIRELKFKEISSRNEVLFYTYGDIDKYKIINFTKVFILNEDLRSYSEFLKNCIVSDNFEIALFEIGKFSHIFIANSFQDGNLETTRLKNPIGKHSAFELTKITFDKGKTWVDLKIEGFSCQDSHECWIYAPLLKENKKLLYTDSSDRIYLIGHERTNEYINSTPNLYRSDNLGKTWVLILENQENLFVEKNGDLIFAYRKEKQQYLSFSLTNGATWNSLKLDSKTGYLDNFKFSENHLSGIFYKNNSEKEFEVYHIDFKGLLQKNCQEKDFVWENIEGICIDGAQIAIQRKKLGSLCRVNQTSHLTKVYKRCKCEMTDLILTKKSKNERLDSIRIDGKFYERKLGNLCIYKKPSRKIKTLHLLQIIL